MSNPSPTPSTGDTTDGEAGVAEQASSTSPKPVGTVDGPGNDPETADSNPTPAEQADEAVLTEVQPKSGAVSEVLTGSAEHPESSRIVPPGEVPASTGSTAPREFRQESQVASTDPNTPGPAAPHGNADY